MTARVIPAVLMALAVATCATKAQAWYFPEHVVLTEDGLAGLPTEVRAALSKSLDEALATERVEVCRGVERTLVRRAEDEWEVPDDCVPLAALPALAGDHSSFHDELSKLLEPEQVGKTLVVAAGKRLVRTFILAKDGDLTGGTRRQLVRDLDQFYFFEDDGYTDRAKASFAHHHAADEALVDLVGGLASGSSTDDALSQMVVHHLRALQLAVRSRSDPTRGWEAFVQHAFALHYLQDAYAAGHFMTRRSEPDRILRLRRHDFACRNGIGVRWALSPHACVDIRHSLTQEPTRPTPCWVTKGDGYLAVDPRELARMRIADAVARSFAQLSVALDPAVARELLDDAVCGDATQAAKLEALASLVDPVPAWSVTKNQNQTIDRGCRRDQRILAGLLHALETLGNDHPITRISGNRRDYVRLPVVGQPFRPCRTQPDGHPGVMPGDTDALCDDGEQLAVGGVDVSLLRPILAVWPVSQARETDLVGEDPFATGFGIQWWGALQAGNLFYDPGSEVTASHGLLSSFGVSYRLHHVMSRRPTADAIGVSGGIMASGFYGSHPRWTGHFLLEVRSQMPSALVDFLSQGAFPFDVLGGWRGYVLLGSTRLRYASDGLRESPITTVGHHLDGMDFEVLTMPIPVSTDIIGQERIDRLPHEIRFRLGCRVRCTALSITLELATGIARVVDGGQ